MELSTVIAKAALTVAVILGVFWGIWLAGWLTFSLGDEHPPADGRGLPTTVEMTTPG